VGDVMADLIVQAPSIVRLRGELQYSLERDRVATATTDFGVTLARVTGAVGTRYDLQQKTSFLQGSVRAELTPWLVARAATNWDMRTDTFVESQLGVDLRFQCYEFSVLFIDRTREIGRTRAEEEVRFSLNLLGIGGPIRTSVGP
jgi:hypothetical protein